MTGLSFMSVARTVTLQESRALRAYARAGVVPPPCRPLDLWAEWLATVELEAERRARKRESKARRQTGDMHPLVIAVMDITDQCGTDAGHQAHHRRGERPCSDCLAAHATYQRRRRQARKAVA